MPVRGCLPHEAELRLKFVAVVAVASGRSPPRAWWPPWASFDRRWTCKPGNVAGDQPLVEAGLGQRVPDIARAARIAALQRRPGPPRASGRLAAPDRAPTAVTAAYGPDAVDAAPQPRPEIGTLIGLQHQGIEEQLAELPVADPRARPGAASRRRGCRRRPAERPATGCCRRRNLSGSCQRSARPRARSRCSSAASFSMLKVHS